MRTSFLGKVHVMPSKYDPETRAKAVRLVLEHREDYPSEWAAITAVSKRLGMNAETLRNWIRQQQVDDGQRDGISSDAAAEIRALKRRNAELEQTIEILKAATTFFARESDPRNRRCPHRSASSSPPTGTVSGSLRSAACCPSTGCRSPRGRSMPGPSGRRRNGPCGTPRSPRSWPATTNPTSTAERSRSRCTGR